MKRHILIGFPLLSLTATAVSIPVGFHADTSSLAEGRWVKIRVDSTGVYQLTADRLRELGFNNPDSVAVFGRGLSTRPDQFMTEEGTPLIDPDLHQTPTMNIGGTLYFFGVGPSWISFVEDEEHPRYERRNKQVSSAQGYYLLTDSREPMSIMTPVTLLSDAGEEIPQQPEVPEQPEMPEALPVLTEGYSYFLHDPNLSQGFYQSGQIYMGELLESRSSILSWIVNLPDAVSNSVAVVTGAAYADDTAGTTTGAAGNQLVFSAGSLTQSTVFPQSDAGQWSNLIPAPMIPQLSGKRLQVRLSVSGSRTINLAGIDYWLVSYTSSLDQSFADGRHVVVLPERGVKTAVPMAGAKEGTIVWNIADPIAPKGVGTITDADGVVSAVVMRGEGEAAPRLFRFDPSQTQMEPEVMGEVANSNLHQQAAKGADLLIITVPMLRGQAQRLAAIHAQYDGLTTIIGEVDDIYNEYSAGQPTVMAYKSLIKQIYQANGAGRHLDVLLLGPIRGDMLGLTATEPIDPAGTIIAYQGDTFPQKGDCHNINEYLGMMDDYITQRPEYATVQVGVGVLPCLSREEADRIVDKIERYITEPNYDLVVGKMLGIGGSGDLQSHIKQAVDLQDYIKGYYGGSVIYTPHMAEAYSKIDAHLRFTDYFNDGFPIISYMGHGSGAGMDRMPMMSTGYQSLIHNRILPFMLFGMCDATRPDRGERGFAEGLVISHDDGLIGGIMSTRTAYSNQNGSMLRNFMSAFSKVPTDMSPDNPRPKSVGQVYAEARTAIRTLHENTFMLVCDPALRLVNPTLRLSLESDTSPVLQLNRRTTLRGIVTTPDGKAVTNFNGRMTVRLVAAPRTIACPMLVTGSSISEDQRAHITYADQVEATFIGEVKDGVWEVTVDPAESQNINSLTAPDIQLSAYDPTTRVGASGRFTIGLIPTTADESEKDTTAPTVDLMEYDQTDGKLRYSVTDDRQISLGNSLFDGGVTIEIDGVNYTLSDYEFEITPGTPFTVSGSIPADALTTGTHSAELYATDLAGNSISRTVTFTVGARNAPTCTLTPSVEVTNTSIIFTCDAASHGRLMIADHNGNVMAFRQMENPEIEFDLCDNDGRRLPQGVYRAWVITDAPDSGYSAPVNFGILAPVERQ